MQRILDLDLDFFVYNATNATGKTRDGPRLDPDEYPAWEVEAALAFIDRKCRLDQRLPGYVVEHHGDLFCCWREAIDAGMLVPPFSVTHVDAHADLGSWDYGVRYLLDELLPRPVCERRYPQTGYFGVGDGNYLLYAIANRWIGALVYVHGGTSAWYEDECLTEPDQYVGRSPGDLEKRFFSRGCLGSGALYLPGDKRSTLAEPLVPFEWPPWPLFRAEEPFDFICLARSPGFTPTTADVVYDAICERYIDERMPYPNGPPPWT